MSTNILIVDDDDVYRDLVAVACQRGKLAERIRPIFLADGSEAIDYLLDPARTPADWPQLVLLDQNMPRLNGLDAVRELRGHPRTQTLPYGIMSSSSLPTEVGQGYQAGASFWVTKPMQFRDLCALLEQMLWFWTDLVELPPTRPLDT